MGRTPSPIIATRFRSIHGNENPGSRFVQAEVQGVLYGDAKFRVGLVTSEFTLDDINTCFENILAGNKVARQIIRYT